jgi:hypothetical protein
VVSRAITKGKTDAALTDFDAAISMDPFAFELMDQKFRALQNLDRVPEALALLRSWQSQAQERAAIFARRIVSRLDAGENLATAVRSVPELERLYSILPEYERVGASLECLIEHLSGELQSRVHHELTGWKRAHTSSET